MIMYTRAFAITLILIIILSGCGEKTSPTPPSGPHVYMSGFMNNSAVYWKDKTLVTLDPAFNTTGIVVNGQDVYVCGNRGYSYQGGTVDRGCYWKNGVRTDLSDPPSNATGIAVLGSDVYVVGVSMINNKYVATIWKNGTATALSTTEGSIANGICISGTDIYVAGQDGAACYWKNGVKTVLDPDGSSNARAVTVVGGDVFVAGNTYTQWLHKQAAYWKNGVRTDLLTGNNDQDVIDSYANGIGVDGNDVHVSGWLNAYDAAYWKNGVMKHLNNPAQYVNIAKNTGNLFMFDHSPFISLNSADYWYKDTVRNVSGGYGTGIFVTAP